MIDLSLLRGSVVSWSWKLLIMFFIQQILKVFHMQFIVQCSISKLQISKAAYPSTLSCAIAFKIFPYSLLIGTSSVILIICWSPFHFFCFNVTLHSLKKKKKEKNVKIFFHLFLFLSTFWERKKNIIFSYIHNFLFLL